MAAETTGTTATYDEHADWYNDFMSPTTGGEYIQRVHATLQDLLGRGKGTCLDVCCGTGAHAPALAGMGWTPVGAARGCSRLHPRFGSALPRDGERPTGSLVSEVHSPA